MTDQHTAPRVPNEDYNPFTAFTLEPNHPSEVNFGELKLTLVKGNMSHAFAISAEDAAKLTMDVVEALDPVQFDPLMPPLTNALEAACAQHLGQEDWDQAPPVVKHHVREHLLPAVAVAVRVAVAQTEAKYLNTGEVERAANAG